MVDKYKLKDELEKLLHFFDFNFNDKEADKLLALTDDESLLQGVLADIVARGQSLGEDIFKLMNNLTGDHTDRINGADINGRDLDAMAEVAKEFDESGDPLLQRQASVLDHVLTIFSKEKFNKTADENDQIDKLKEKYRQREMDEKYKNPSIAIAKQDNTTGVADKMSETFKKKQYRPMEAALSTRTCQDHAGVPLIRVGEDVYQCNLDKKIFDFKQGYTLNSGTKVPGSAVENQNRSIYDNVNSDQQFDSREGRSNK